MTLDLYFGRQFLSAFIRSIIIVALLIIVVDTLEHVRSLSGHGASFSQAFGLVLLKTPGFISLVLPVIIVIGSLTFCVGLARSNEFVVSRASGVSALRSIAFPVLFAFLFGVFTIILLNPLLTVLSTQYTEQISKFRGSTQQLSISEDGFWLRQKNLDGHTVIHAKTTNDTGSLLRSVTAIDFDEAGDAQRRIEARTAVLFENAWVFARGKKWDVSKQSTNPEQTAEEFQILRLPTTITSVQILQGYPAPEGLSIWELPRFIDAIEKAGFSSVRHRVHFNMELSRPFLFVAMVIIGAVFTLQTSRLGNLGVAVLLALVSGFSLHFLQNLARTLAEAGEISIIVAAWFPPIAAIMLVIALFLHFEDG